MPISLTPAWGYTVSRATWRALVRAELGDENASAFLWSTALLNEWLAEAIRDYARTVPREETATLTTVASQAAYDLPLGLVEVVRVEHPANVFRVHQPRVGGDLVSGVGSSVSYPPTPISRPPTYDVWRGQLVLEPAPTASGETLAVRYTTRRAEPSADTDPLPVEGGDEELLLLYVCGRAMQWISTQEGKRQAFERERGAAASALADTYEQRYRAAIAARQRTRSRQRRLVVRDP